MKKRSNQYQEYNDADLSFVEEIEEFQEEFHDHSINNVNEWLKIFRFPRNLIFLNLIVIGISDRHLAKFTTGMIYRLFDYFRGIAIPLVLVWMGLDWIVHKENQKAGATCIVIGGGIIIYLIVQIILNYKYIR